MGTLGAPEILIILVMYIILGPAVLCLAARVLIWFSGVIGIPEALGRFGAVLGDAYRKSRSAQVVDQEPVAWRQPRIARAEATDIAIRRETKLFNISYLGKKTQSLKGGRYAK